MKQGFFDHIDTSRPILLIGDTDHKSEELKAYLRSEQFIADALNNGYESVLIEQPPHTPTDTLRKDYPLNEVMGLPVIPVDPRSDEHYVQILEDQRQKVRALKTFIAASAKPDEIEEMGNLLRKKLRDNACSADPQLLQTILEYAKDKRVIVIYGSNHFEKGSILEQGIPEHQRNIVFIHSFGADNQRELMDTSSADTKHYSLYKNMLAAMGYYEDSPRPERKEDKPSVKPTLYSVSWDDL